jgi:hypothetical protein
MRVTILLIVGLLGSLPGGLDAQDMAPYTFKPRQARPQQAPPPPPPPGMDSAAAESAMAEAERALKNAQSTVTDAREAYEVTNSQSAAARTRLGELETQMNIRKPGDPAVKLLEAERQRYKELLDRTQTAEQRLTEAIRSAEELKQAADDLKRQVDAAAARAREASARAETLAEAEQRLAAATARLDERLLTQCNRFFLFAPPQADRVEAAATVGLDAIWDAREAVAGAKEERDGARTLAEREGGAGDARMAGAPESEARPCTGVDSNQQSSCRFAWLLEACSKRLDEASAATARQDSTTVAHADLVSQYLSYIRLRKWAKAAGMMEKPTLAQTTLPQQVSTRATFDALSARMPDRLKKHNLMQLFSAVLVSGPMFGDTGEVASDMNGKSADFGGMATILWQSAHFGSEDGWGKWDFTMGGRFGLQPVLLMVKEDTEAGDEAEEGEVQDGDVEEGGDEPAPEPEHQQALGYTMGIGVNRRIGDYSELSVSTKIGGSYLLAGPLLVDRGVSDSYVAVAADNGTGRTAWMWEAGVDFNMFNAPVTLLHIAKDLLSPQLSAGLAIRRDSRFKKDGDLLAFDNPEWRLVYRFMLDAVTVADRRQVGEDPKSFTFGFGVEYERALKGSSTIPSGTRFIIRGNVNLFKALKGGEAGTAEEPQTGEGEGQ